LSVMWSEIVGLGQDRSETRKIGLGLGLAGFVLFCEWRSCHARRHNDLEGHSNFARVLFIVSLFCAWNIVPLFTSGDLGLGLGLENLVLFTSLKLQFSRLCNILTHIWYPVPVTKLLPSPLSDNHRTFVATYVCKSRAL